MIVRIHDNSALYEVALPLLFGHPPNSDPPLCAYKTIQTIGNDCYYLGLPPVNLNLNLNV